MANQPDTPNALIHTNEPIIAPKDDEEEVPLLEVTEMSMDDVMLQWDGESVGFNEELRNRPETNCYGYWQKKLAEKRREEEEARRRQSLDQG